MGFRFSPGCECCQGDCCIGELNSITIKIQGVQEIPTLNCGCDFLNGTFKLDKNTSPGAPIACTFFHEFTPGQIMNCKDIGTIQFNGPLSLFILDAGILVSWITTQGQFFLPTPPPDKPFLVRPCTDLAGLVIPGTNLATFCDPTNAICTILAIE